MSEQRACQEGEALVTYLYGEADPGERARFEAHLLSCVPCRRELEALRSVRARLAAWKPADRALGFRLVRDPVVAPLRRRWYSVPAWAQAAAAVLLLAAAAAVANLDVRYGKDGLVVRTGWQKPAVQAPAAAPWRADLAALGRDLRSEFQASQPVTVPAAAPSVSDEDLVRRIDAVLRSGRVDVAPAAPADGQTLKKVEGLIQASEDRQRRELAMRLLQLTRDLDGQRRLDLARIQQGFGQIESRTALESNQTREAINYFMRVSQKK
jgi:anti-sigma factor RsiW